MELGAFVHQPIFHVICTVFRDCYGGLRQIRPTLPMLPFGDALEHNDSCRTKKRVLGAKISNTVFVVRPVRTPQALFFCAIICIVGFSAAILAQGILAQ